MPCYSRITTKMDNQQNLVASLEAQGYEVTTNGSTVYATQDGRRHTFDKGTSGAYSLRATLAQRELSAIGRSYAEAGVKQFASRRGFSIVSNDGKTIRLVNRRG